MYRFLEHAFERQLRDFLKDLFDYYEDSQTKYQDYSKIDPNVKQKLVETRRNYFMKLYKGLNDAEELIIYATKNQKFEPESVKLEKEECGELIDKCYALTGEMLFDESDEN